MSVDNFPAWLDMVNWNSEGLVPAVAQDRNSGKVLTLAWMNRESLVLTAREGRAVYWSRSRQKLWRKGEESGHIQEIEEIRLDCDQDTILLVVNQQQGVACHTGRESCFFYLLENQGWKIVEPVIKDPGQMYKREVD